MILNRIQLIKKLPHVDTQEVVNLSYRLRNLSLDDVSSSSSIPSTSSCVPITLTTMSDGIIKIFLNASKDAEVYSTIIEKTKSPSENKEYISPFYFSSSF